MAELTRRAWLLAPFAAGWLAGCAPLEILDRLTPEGRYRLEPGISFGPDPRQRLDVYVPEDGEGGFARPIVLFLYGGSWKEGQRSDYRFVGEWLTRHGYLAVIADYRLHPPARFPEFVEDGAAALAWTRANAARLGGDPRRVFVVGHSAGGYNAALLALDPRYLAEVGLARDAIAGVISISTPYEIQPLRIDWARPIFAGADLPRTRPIELARSGGPPMLLLHGDADSLVPADAARRMHARLEQEGAPSALRVYPMLGHIDIMLGLSSAFGDGLAVGADVLEFLAAR